MITKENHLNRQHFLRCDEALITALKAKQNITSLLEDFVLAGKNVADAVVEERLQSAVEVSLRRHPEALKDILPYVTTPLPPILLLTAVYTNKLNLVQQIIAHVDPAQSHGLSLEVAAGRNNFDVFCAVLSIASDAKFAKVLEHVLHHKNEEIFALIHPLLNQHDIECVHSGSLGEQAWAQKMDWMAAQIQRSKIADEIKCTANVQKVRKM